MYKCKLCEYIQEKKAFCCCDLVKVVVGLVADELSRIKISTFQLGTVMKSVGINDGQTT